MDTIEPKACCPRIEKEDPNVSLLNTEQLDPSLVWHLTLIDEANATKSNEDSLSPIRATLRHEKVEPMAK
jgi:hypothetical protein